MEDILPPVVRDSKPFAWLMGCAHPLVHKFASFRHHAHELNVEEYASLYRRIGAMKRVHENTDNSAAVLEEILKRVVPGRIIDVGCGTGYTLSFLMQRLQDNGSRFTGVDFQIDPRAREQLRNADLLEHDILRLPVGDASFDTVLCSHTLEHILDVRAAVAELRRICAKRLILVVPREREGLYTFNPHFQFFPYVHSFLRVMIPLPKKYSCWNIGRDIIYIEDKDIAEASNDSDSVEPRRRTNAVSFERRKTYERGEVRL